MHFIIEYIFLGFSGYVYDLLKTSFICTKDPLTSAQLMVSK